MKESAGEALGGERLAAGQDVLAIKVEDEVVVFHMTKGRYYGLRGAAGIVWEKIEAGTDRADAIVEEIVAGHRGDADHIRTDVAKTIAEMKQSGILVSR